MSKSAKSVKDVMTRDVQWVSPTATITEVAKKMQDKNCGCVLVGEKDKLIGVVTDYDIITRVIARGLNPAQTDARVAMSSKVLYCRENDAIDAAAKNMARGKIRRLLVVDADKRMVGIVSLGDLSGTAAGQEASGIALSDICQSGAKKAAA